MDDLFQASTYEIGDHPNLFLGTLQETLLKARNHTKESRKHAMFSSFSEGVYQLRV
jgi:hypothetical protein